MPRADGISQLVRAGSAGSLSQILGVGILGYFQLFTGTRCIPPGPSERVSVAPLVHMRASIVIVIGPDGEAITVQGSTCIL